MNVRDRPASDTVISKTKTSSGVEGLDRILEGGFPRGEVYLIQGDPGAGKTVLGLQFLLAGQKRGERGLFLTVTQSKADLQDSARSHDWTLDDLAVHQIAAGRAAGRGAADQVLFETSEVELGEVMAEVKEVLEAVQPDLVVFDAIAELRFLAVDPGRFHRQLFELRELFADRGATVLLLDRQRRRSGSDELEHIAHGVIQLEQASTDLGTERRRLRIVKMRGMGYHAGYHDIEIDGSGMVVYPRLRAEVERDTEWTPLRSGVPSLDELVGGGLAEGTSCLLVGPSGTGKSSVATLYACAAADRGEAVVSFLFEERPETFIRRSEGLGLPVTKHLDSGRMELHAITTGELSPGAFAETVRQQVAERDVRVVVIDSLTGYISAMPSQQQQLTQMHDLLQYLSGQGVLTILIVSQHGILGPSLGGPVDVSYLADTVLLLRHFEAEGAIRQAISVFKKRYGNHEKQIRQLSMSEDGIRVGEPLSAFQGLLTGVPKFMGDQSRLNRPEI